VLLAEVVDALGDVLGERDDLLPRARGLEALGNEVVVLAEVADVGDDEGEEVASEPVGRSSLEPHVLGRSRIDVLLLGGSHFARSLEQRCSCRHGLRVVALDLRHVELLYRVDHVLRETLLRLQRLSELELDVVHQSQRCRPDPALADFLHELASGVVVRENIGVVNRNIRQRSHSQNHLGDNAEISFMP